jgi:hypothetical protein
MTQVSRDLQGVKQAIARQFGSGQPLVNRAKRCKRDCLSNLVLRLAAKQEGPFKVVLCLLWLAKIFENRSYPVEAAGFAPAITDHPVQFRRSLEYFKGFPTASFSLELDRSVVQGMRVGYIRH